MLPDNVMSAERGCTILLGNQRRDLWQVISEMDFKAQARFVQTDKTGRVVQADVPARPDSMQGLKSRSSDCSHAPTSKLVSPPGMLLLLLFSLLGRMGLVPNFTKNPCQRSALAVLTASSLKR